MSLVYFNDLYLEKLRELRDSDFSHTNYRKYLNRRVAKFELSNLENLIVHKLWPSSRK